MGIIELIDGYAVEDIHLGIHATTPFFDTREEAEQYLAEELGYMSNTQTPTIFAREIEKFWEGDAS